MAGHDLQELKIEDVKLVGLFLRQMDLFDQRLQDDLNWKILVLQKRVQEVVQDELPDVEVIMILDHDESDRLVDDHRIGVRLLFEGVKEPEEAMRNIKR